MTTHANIYQLSSPLRVAGNARWAERILLLTILIIVDLAMILLGFWLAYVLRFEISFSWFYQHQQSQLDFYRWLVVLMAPFWIGVFGLFGLYDFRRLFGGMAEYTRAFNACTLSIMLIIFFTFFEPEFVVARGWVILSWLLVSFCVLLGRFMIRRVVQRLRTKGRFLTMILIVGANEEGQAIAQQFQSNPKAGICVVGFADDEYSPDGESPVDIPILGSIDSLPVLAERYGIQEIVVASTAVRREQLLTLFQSFNDTDIPVRTSSGLYEVDNRS
jgi:FlaA1/EpsC-like NDP-sugar epimerase